MALKGSIPWNKGKHGLQAAWNKGKPWSEEMKEKLKQSHTLKEHYRWNGGTVKINGRVWMRIEKGVYRKIARVLAENALGRPLKETEVIHHIDCDKNNDKLNNLFLFRHQSAHKRWHHFQDRHNLDGRILESNIKEYVVSHE